ncbi:hypothetical protein FJ657_11770 [Schumannella soli]|uniref:Uncharacterized protein n=1 Tax=Schumannella soli TaxID=2590779 RepID=A0A506Y4D2_9MICO|nr:hypothetical protein FJ657_11770 [Schumannella soli]
MFTRPTHHIARQRQPQSQSQSQSQSQLKSQREPQPQRSPEPHPGATAVADTDHIRHGTIDAAPHPGNRPQTGISSNSAAMARACAERSTPRHSR